MHKDFLDELVKSLRHPTQWPDLCYMFDKHHRLGSAEFLLFAGPLGVYLLQFCEFGIPTLKPLLIDLLFVLEMLQARVHTDATLELCQQELVRVLSDLEIILPLCWNSNVIHVLLHLCKFIKACGPFHTHSMLSFERWHTVFKKLIRSTHHIMASIRNHYAMYWSTNIWQSESMLGDQWLSHPYRSTTTSRVDNDYDDIVFHMGKRQRRGALPIGNGEAFVQVQDQWAVVHKDYDELRDRYRRFTHTHTTQLNSTQLNSTQLSSTQLSSTQLNSAQLNSTQLNSTQLNSTQHSSTLLNTPQHSSTLPNTPRPRHNFRCGTP